METDVLKKALVEFLVDVVLEVKARTVIAVEDRLKLLSTDERKLLVERSQRAVDKPIPPMPRFISMAQAGQYWGASAKGFRQMLDRLFAELPKGIVVRVGKRTRVDIRAFEDWLVSKEANPRRRT